MSKPFLTVILPCYNEIKNLKRDVLVAIDKYLNTQDYTSEVIVSDDGSSDGSIEFVKKFATTHPRFSVLENSHAGKASALSSALKKATGDYTLFTDMDQSTPISELDKLVPYTRDGDKVVIGSRGIVRNDAPLYRKLASVIFMLARRSILLPEIVDTQCGYKLLETKLARVVFKKMLVLKNLESAKGWKVTAYDVEMLYIAKKLGNKITEVRVIWNDEDTSVGKERNFVKESIDMIIQILRVRYNDLRGRYN